MSLFIRKQLRASDPRLIDMFRLPMNQTFKPMKANCRFRCLHFSPRCLLEPVPSIYPHTEVHPPKDYDALAYRHWIKLRDLGPEAFSVMSFNLLSQHYVWKQVFEYLDPRYLDWPHYRFPLINRTIQQLRCDIMCFQELECLVYQNHWQDLFPLDNYQLVYLRKPQPGYWGTKPPEFMDGVGIFFNKDRFELVESRNVHFGSYVSTHSDRFELTEDVTSRLIPRNTVALLMLLYDKLRKKHLFVTNTHLYWLPEFNDVKVMQTKLLLNALARFTADSGLENTPVLMCGDFNSTPTSSVYKLLSRGKVNLDSALEFQDRWYGALIDGQKMGLLLENPFALAPAYGPLLDNSLSENLDFTSYTRSLTAVLDHIWFSRDQLAATKVLGKVEKSYSVRAPGFPDRQFPSDHICLVSEIDFV